MSGVLEVAKRMVGSGKGILAADWSVGTAVKKFGKEGIKCTKESRSKYREMLFSTPDLEKYISGVILHDETIRQKTGDGMSLSHILSEKGILVGIRIDAGQVDMPGFKGEKISEGMDGLRKKLEEYKSFGASFAKWRAVYTISDLTPSRMNIVANTLLHTLYAKYCLEAGIVPIVEPDVLMTGNHGIEKCATVTREVLERTFMTLCDFGVDRKSVVLKPNMVLPGNDSTERVSPANIAEKTLEVMRTSVPIDVPGIAFLSGGQKSVEATENLNEINKIKGVPWQMTFSFARAIQEPVLTKWRGKEENIREAQEALLKRSLMNAKARSGEWKKEMEEDE